MKIHADMDVVQSMHDTTNDGPLSLEAAILETGERCGALPSAANRQPASHTVGGGALALSGSSTLTTHNTSKWPHADSMLGQRRRHWPNIEPL